MRPRCEPAMAHYILSMMSAHMQVSGVRPRCAENSHQTLRAHAEGTLTQTALTRTMATTSTRREFVSMARSLSPFDALSKWNRSTSRTDTARRSNWRIAQRNATRSLTVLGASHSTPPLHFSPAHTLLRQVNRSASYPARASKRVPRTTPARAANPLPVAV
jgi:hypothetical protein